MNNGFAYRPFCAIHHGDTSIFAADPSLAQRTLLLVWPGQADLNPHVDSEVGHTCASTWLLPLIRRRLLSPHQLDNHPDQSNVARWIAQGSPAGWEAAALHAYLEAGGQTVVYVGEREEKIDAAIGSRPDVGVSASRAFQVRCFYTESCAAAHHN